MLNGTLIPALVLYFDIIYKTHIVKLSNEKAIPRDFGFITVNKPLKDFQEALFFVFVFFLLLHF